MAKARPAPTTTVKPKPARKPAATKATKRVESTSTDRTKPKQTRAFNSVDMSKVNSSFNGNDLERLQYALDLSVEDFTWMMGIGQTISTHFHKFPTSPILEPVIAIHGRFIADHRDASMVRPKLDPAEVFAFLSLPEEILPKSTFNDDIEWNTRTFALAFGRHITSGYRWTSGGGDTPSSVQRAMLTLVTYIENKIGRTIDDCLEFKVSEKDAQVILDYRRHWMSLAEREAFERGIPRLWDVKNWLKERKIVKNQPDE